MRTTQLVLLWLCIPLSLTVHTKAVSAKSLNDAMKECANIQRDLKRLACFDSLSGRVSDFNVEAMTQQQRSTTQPAQQQAQAVQAQQPGVATVLPQSPEDSFGLKESSRPDDGLDVITTYIPGKFTGWRKGDQVTLANGQIWEVTNGSVAHSATNPKIEISRGVFGSFRMKVVGLNRTSQVKRIQ